MTLWVKHTKAERIALLQRAEGKFNINQLALEKDCWVTMVLNALFKCSCSKELISDWKSDYTEMREHFIYGNKLSFEELINRMKELQERFRKIK